MMTLATSSAPNLGAKRIKASRKVNDERLQILELEREAAEAEAEKAIKTRAEEITKTLQSELSSYVEETDRNWAAVAGLDTRGVKLPDDCETEKFICTWPDYDVDESYVHPYQANSQIEIILNAREYLHPAFQRIWDKIKEMGLEPTLHHELRTVTLEAKEYDDHGQMLSGGSYTFANTFVLGAKFPACTASS